MKKILTTIICITMLFSLTAVPAFAEDSTTESTETTTISDQVPTNSADQETPAMDENYVELQEGVATDNSSVENASRIPVITYHHLVSASKVKKIKSYKSLYVTDINFDKQMKWLNENGWRTIDTEEFTSWYNGEILLPKKSVLITFDDGNYSVVKFAAPILKKYNMKGTMFVVGKYTKEKANTTPNSSGKYKEIGFDTIKFIKKNYPNMELQSHTFAMHDRVNVKSYYTKTIKKKGKKRTVTKTKTVSMKPVYGFTNEQIRKDLNLMNEKFGFTAIAYPWGTYSDKMISELEASGRYGIGFTYGDNAFATRDQHRYKIRRIKINGTESFSKFTRWFN